MSEKVIEPNESLLLSDESKAADSVLSQTYVNLVWRRFKRSKTGVLGGIMVIFLLFCTVFANFLAPYDPMARNGDRIYLPPQSLHFTSESTSFSIVPFTYPQIEEYNYDTFEMSYVDDVENPCHLEFFASGWRYRLFGFETDKHLFSPVGNCSFHVFGTDRDGRDMLSRLLVGSQLSLLMAGVVVVSGLVIGTTLGIISGYKGGRVDEWIQRVTELTLALPELPLYFALVSVIPRSATPMQTFMFLTGILCMLKWAQLCREVRGKTLALRNLDYVTGAEAIGCQTPRIIYRHILPNVMSHIVVVATIGIPSVVLIESFLSFLGLGVQPPMVSWGLLLNAGKDLQNLGSYPWVLSPVLAILVTVLGFNMLGDGLRDAIDPYAE